MEKQWWCVSCLTEVDLDTHGRCSGCGSDAVDMIVFPTTALLAGETGALADGTREKELVAQVVPRSVKAAMTVDH
jgi:hypothetical protein